MAIRMLSLYYLLPASKLIQFENLISNSIFYHNILSTIWTVELSSFFMALLKYWSIWMDERKLQPGFNLFIVYALFIRHQIKCNIGFISSIYASRISTSVRSVQVIIRKRSPICTRFQREKNRNKNKLRMKRNGEHSCVVQTNEIVIWPLSLCVKCECHPSSIDTRYQTKIRQSSNSTRKRK